MPALSDLDLQSMRRLWRAFPAGALARHPNLRSRVFLDENGSTIGISEHGGRFAVPLPTGVVTFRKLEDAEVFAAGALFEREGVSS